MVAMIISANTLMNVKFKQCNLSNYIYYYTYILYSALCNTNKSSLFQIYNQKEKKSSSEQNLLKRFQSLCRFIFISESFKSTRLYYTTTHTEIYAYTNANHIQIQIIKRVSTKKVNKIIIRVLPIDK